MQYSPKIDEFLITVCEQIRWKKAHNIVTEEIRNHIIDQQNAYINENLNEESALDMALKEMGDPVVIGTELDRTHRPKTEWSIFLLTSIMIIAGFVIRYIASFEPNTSFMFERSLLTTAVGIVCMLIAYFVDFTILGRFSKSIFIGTIIFTFLSMIITSPYGRSRIFIFFDSSYILILLPTIFAGIIYNMRTKGYLGIILSGTLFTIPLLIGYRFSFTLFALLFASFLILLTFAILKGYFNVNKLYGSLLIYIPSLLMTILALITLGYHSYSRERLLNIFNPLRDPMGYGYIGAKMRDMILNAKFVGQGTMKMNSAMIPGINTDYILTYLIHRLGWISFIAVLGIMLLFVINAFKLCNKQKSILGKLVSMGVLTTFIMEVILYLISNLGISVGNYSLPFISYGGMSTIINMTLIGIMLSVFRTGDVVKDRHLEKKKIKFLS